MIGHLCCLLENRCCPKYYYTTSVLEVRNFELTDIQDEDEVAHHNTQAPK